MGCILLMVISSKFSTGQYRADDHQEDAPHFSFKTYRWWYKNVQLNLVKINMNSSEWKILRQWLEFGEISQIDQLIVKIHLHWSGKVPTYTASFRWSFCPHSAWGSKESTNILTTHPSLLVTILNFQTYLPS